MEQDRLGLVQGPGGVAAKAAAGWAEIALVPVHRVTASARAAGSESLMLRGRPVIR